MYRLEDYSHLALRRISKGNWVQLMCLKTTADFYGWSDAFLPITEAKLVDYSDGVMRWPRKLNGRNYRSLRLYICREKLHRRGYPRDLTNCFRVTRNVATRDLYALAQAVKVDFGWMNDQNYRRVRRAEWLRPDLEALGCASNTLRAHCSA